MMNSKILIAKAVEAMENAYAPYSSFKVGAALLSKSGRVFTGCNIENSAFSPINCAERTAIFKAVSEGKTDFVRIAVVGGAADSEISNYCPPCGVCRQVLKEFCKPDFEIIVAKNENDYKVMTLAEILPFSFDKREV